MHVLCKAVTPLVFLGLTACSTPELVKPGADKAARGADYLECLKATAPEASAYAGMLGGETLDIIRACMLAKGWRYGAS